MRPYRGQLTDPIVHGRVLEAWNDAPWLFGAAAGSPVRHNLTTPLLDQLAAAIGAESVEELTIHAPFYDSRCQALDELIKRCRPKRLRVLLQEGVTSVDPKHLTRVLSSARAVDVRAVNAEERGTFLHAKFVIAKLKNRAVCMQGSPNLSTPAFLRAHPDGNIELANILTGAADAFDHLVLTLTLSDHPVEVSSLRLRLVTDDEEGDDIPQGELTSEFVVSPVSRVFGNMFGNLRPCSSPGDPSMSDVPWRNRTMVRRASSQRSAQPGKHFWT